MQNKFGSKEYFENYISGQIEKEGKTQELIHRIHYSMTNFIFENFKGKEAMMMIFNLHAICEQFSRSMSKVNRFSRG